ncbi:hypothetical protein [Cytobacillus oceanisediminis]|nr:hypothetical protein [Cytobacillus oceanisediminis]
MKAVYSELEVKLAPPKSNEKEGSATKVDSIPFLIYFSMDALD